MTKDEALSLPPGRELDAVVGRLLQVPPTTFSGVSSDGGESWCAWVDREHGPWYSYAELKSWLEENHAKGRSLEYQIVNQYRWPRYSESIEAAWQVVEKMKDHLPELVWRCGDSEPFSEMRWWCYFRRDQTTGPDCHGSAAESAPLAICRAALKACWQD